MGKWKSFEIANVPAINTWLANGPREWAPAPVPEPEPEPEPPPAPEPDGYVVGSGVKAAMEAEGDTPANNEVYLLPGPDYFSLTLGASGNLYAATPRTGVVVYDPKAPGQ